MVTIMVYMVSGDNIEQGGVRCVGLCGSTHLGRGGQTIHAYGVCDSLGMYMRRVESDRR